MDIALESFNYDAIDEGLDIKAKFKKIFKAIIDKIIDVAKKFAAALKKLNQRFSKKKPNSKPEEIKPEPESTKEATDDEIMKDILANRLKIHTYSSLAMDEAIKLVKQKAGDIKLSNVYPELSKKRLDDVSAIIHDIESVLFDDLFGISVDKLKNEKDPIAYIIAASSRTLSKVEALGIGSMGDDDFASKLSDMVTGGTHTLEECLQSEIYQYSIDQMSSFGFRPDMLEFAVSSTNIHCDIYSRDSVSESIESGKAAMSKFVERLDNDSVAAADAVKQIVSKWSVVFAAMTTYYLKMATSVYEVTREYIKIVDEAIVDVMTNNASVRHAIAEKCRRNTVAESCDFCNVR